MTFIYRLRPVCDLTIEELHEPYLWFSRPNEYKDVEDANIFAFVNKNESIKSSFERIYRDYKEITSLSKLTGICCFTKTLPEYNQWKIFPKGFNGIFIEYNKANLENHFIEKLALSDCFKEVEYSSTPTLFPSLSADSILWKKDIDNNAWFKPLRVIEKDPKLLDELFLKMFTRINSKFQNQHEARIILGGKNIPDKSQHIKGYKINIPIGAINKIFTHPQTPKPFIEQIKKTNITVVEAL